MFKTNTASSINLKTLGNGYCFSFTTDDKSANDSLTVPAVMEATVDISSSTAVVPAEPTRSDFVKQFSLLAAKTAMATLEMCKVVSDAHAALDHSEFTKFCNDIGRKEDDATIKKYLAIGRAYPRFIAYADRLPNAWTSIYAITQISENKFAELMFENVDMKEMTGHAIRKILGKENSSSSNLNSRKPYAMIYFKREPTVPQWNYFLAHLKNVIEGCQDLELEFEVTPVYKNLIKSIKRENKKMAQAQKKIDAAAKKERERQLAERDLPYRPDLFDYGSTFDKTKGDFVI